MTDEADIPLNAGVPATELLTKPSGAEREPGHGRGHRGLVALPVVLALLGFVALGLSRMQIDTSVDSFLPQGVPASKAIDDRAASFGGDPVIVLLESSEPRALLTGEDLLALVDLEGRLARLDNVAAVYGPGTVLNQTAGTAQDVLAQISGRRDALRNQAVAEARRRGATPAQALAVGREVQARFDERYGSLLVEAAPAGLPTMRNQQFVDAILYEQDGTPRPRWRFVVPNSRTVSILIRPGEGIDQDDASRMTDQVRRTIADAPLDVDRVTVTGVPVLTSSLSERAKDEVPILGVLSVVLVALILTLSRWTRRLRQRPRPLIAALVGSATTLALFAWLDSSISLGVAAFLPILLGIGSDFPIYLSRGGDDRRALSAAAAAAVGFGSLAVSPLPFVKELGLALAAGIVLTAAAALGLRFLLGPVEPDKHSSEGDVKDTSEASTSGNLARSPRRLDKWRIGWALSAIVAAVGWFLLPQLPVTAQPEELAQGIPEVTNVEYAESVLGSAGEVSVVVKGDDVARPEVLAWATKAEARLVTELGDVVHPVISLGDIFGFLGPDATATQVDSAIALLPDYLTSSVLRSDRKEGLIILGVEFDDVAELGRTLAEVRGALGPPPPGVSVELVGLPVAASTALGSVENGRMWINLLGIAAALAVVGAGTRSLKDTMAAGATVFLATGWVALLAWSVVGSLNPLTVAIGALITATGVEFAVMLRRRNGRGASARTVATAAVAGTAGYLVLAWSDLAVLRQFGLLLAAGVAFSFLAGTATARLFEPNHDQLKGVEG